MSYVGYKQVTVREDTYEKFEKFRGFLIIRMGKKITQDEALKELLNYIPNEIKVMIYE